MHECHKEITEILESDELSVYEKYEELIDLGLDPEDMLEYLIGGY